MFRSRDTTIVVMLAMTLVAFTAGCRTARQSQVSAKPLGDRQQLAVADSRVQSAGEPLQLVSIEDEGDDSAEVLAAVEESASESSSELPGSEESLADLESFAIQNNPTLRRMEQEAAAASEKSRYVAALPDPSLDSKFFIPPMNFEPDRQVADVQLTQMIPSGRRESLSGRATARYR
jgi:hypothetical protein